MEQYEALADDFASYHGDNLAAMNADFAISKLVKWIIREHSLPDPVVKPKAVWLMGEYRDALPNMTAAESVAYAAKQRQPLESTLEAYDRIQANWSMQ